MLDFMFKPVSAAKVRSEQLYEAERLHLDYAAMAEHTAALRDMYAARIARLRAEAAKVDAQSDQ